MNWALKPAPAQSLPHPPSTPDAEELAELVDEFLRSYIFWRESCEDVRAAYEDWATCAPRRRGLAFESYHAALDWEELAAQLHSGRAARVHAATAARTG
jgi:hypothetical protein